MLLLRLFSRHPFFGGDHLVELSFVFGSELFECVFRNSRTTTVGGGLKYLIYFSPLYKNWEEMESNLTTLAHICFNWGLVSSNPPPSTPTTRTPWNWSLRIWRRPGAEFLFFSVGPIDWFKKVSEEWSRKPCFSQWLCLDLYNCI